MYRSIRNNRKGSYVAPYVLDEIHCTGKTNVLPVDNNIMESHSVNIEINNRFFRRMV